MKTRSIILIICSMFFCSHLWAEGHKIACGSWIEIAAHPLEDYHFVKWNDDNTDSIRQIQVHEDATYIAHFAANCEEYANWPIVSLYDWLLMVDVRTINEMGYYFTPADVTWYRIVGEPDDMHDSFPQDDQEVTRGSYYLTIDQSLKGTGSYYAVIDVSDSQGMFCDGLMRSVIISYAGSNQPAKVALFPTAVSMGQAMQLKGLNPNENSEIFIYSTTGQLIEQFVSTNETTIQLHAGHVAGCYQVVVKSPSISQTLRYIVNNR